MPGDHGWKVTEIGEPDYKDVPLVRYTGPDLSRVISWICFEAQSMTEPPWQTKLAKIKQDDDIRYVAAMFVWFRRWRIRSGSWPLLPRFCSWPITIDTVNLRLAPTLAKIDLSLGELQALEVLTMLQCMAELGPQKPVQGTISHCVELIMRQLKVLDISHPKQSWAPLFWRSREAPHWSWMCLLLTSPTYPWVLGSQEICMDMKDRIQNQTWK